MDYNSSNPTIGIKYTLLGDYLYITYRVPLHILGFGVSEGIPEVYIRAFEDKD